MKQTEEEEDLCRRMLKEAEETTGMDPGNKYYLGLAMCESECLAKAEALPQQPTLTIATCDRYQQAERHAKPGDRGFGS